MALSATAANVTIISQDATSLLVKLTYHANTAVDEVDVLKVNAATLFNRTLILTANVVPAGHAAVGFVPGEKVTSNTSTANAFVLNWNPVTRILDVVYENGSNTFTVGEAVTGAQIGSTIVLDAVTNPLRKLHINGIWWSISEAANATNAAKVEIEFGGQVDGSNTTPTFTTAVTLSGSGVFSRNTFPCSIVNDAAFATGNIYVSTHGLPIRGGYTILLDLRKADGFAARPIY